MASKSGVCVTMVSNGMAVIQRERAPRIVVGTIISQQDGAGVFSGWRIASVGERWWATCPGSFKDAKAIAHQHFANVPLDGRH